MKISREVDRMRLKLLTLRSLIVAAFWGAFGLGCTHEAALDKAVATGDAKKMAEVCAGRHFGFQTPVSDETRARACVAREEYDRAQIPTLSCDEAQEKYLFYASHERPPPPTSLAFAKRLVSCGRWLALWSVYQKASSGVPPILVGEAKTKSGEATVRTLLATAPSWAVEQIVMNLDAVDAASGPDFTDDVASAYDRLVDPYHQETVFEYLVHRKHPRASTLAGTFLMSSNQKVRRLGCWGAGELGDPTLRNLVEQVAATDSYSEIAGVRGGEALSQRFIVREKCREALAKMPR
jgi:hypothetical protein